MTNFEPNLIGIILVVATIGLIPLAVVTMTGFLKISIVLFLIRNALGVQQSPPNLVLYGIALILTVYVTTPLIGEVYNTLANRPVDLQSVEGLRSAGDSVRGPLQSYLSRFAHQREREFFMQATKSIWSADAQANLKDDDLVILIPSFVSSELTRAFEIGFRSTSLSRHRSRGRQRAMAMGMMMVSPTLISIPLKIFLFVAVEGWSRLMHGLILSYSG